MNSSTCASLHFRFRPSSFAMMAATFGAASTAALASRIRERVLLARTSSTVRAISSRTAQTTSPTRGLRRGWMGSAKAGSDPISASTAGASEP